MRRIPLHKATILCASLVTHTTVLQDDGVCNLCNGGLHFVARRDQSGRMQFASVQSGFGRRLLEREKLSRADAMERFVFIAEDNDDGSKGQSCRASAAAFEVAKRMDAPWNLFGHVGQKIVPLTFGDAVYDAIAKRRYRLFGKTERCQLPTADFRSRFVDYEEEEEKGGS